MFDSAKLKVQWANSHTKHLNSIITEFLKTDFYTLSNEFDDKTGQYRINLSAKTQPPAEIYLILGDIIHNLRSALDHVAFEITGSEKNYFPFHEKIVNLVSADGTLVCANVKAIESAIPSLGRFIIDEIKPYRAGNATLWPLTKLDAIDKHRFLIPAITLTSVRIPEMRDDCDNTIFDFVATVGATGTLNLIGSATQFKLYGKIQPSFDVLFTEDTFFKDEPVIPTVLNISQVVSETLHNIEKFITRAKETSA